MPNPPSTVSCSPFSPLDRDERQQSTRSGTCDRITINSYLAFSSFAREGSWLASRRAAISLNRQTVWTVNRQMSQGCKIAAFAEVRRPAAGAQTTAAVCKAQDSWVPCRGLHAQATHPLTCKHVTAFGAARVSEYHQAHNRKAAQHSEA